MSKLGYNQILLIVCWLLVAGVGAYLTFFRQQSELSHLEREVRLQEKKKADIEALLAEMATTKERADEVVDKWRARYKIIPQTISTPEIVGYLNELTQHGFEQFDIVSAGAQSRQGYSFHTFSAKGRGYYSSLYRFIWQVENSRLFYRVRSLRLSHIDVRSTNKETGQQDLKIMVSFEMNIDAFYGGPKGMSADASAPAVAEAEPLPVGRTDEAPPVPSDVLPDMRPATDPFYPIIMEQLPPNEHNLVDVEKAELVSIVEGKAVFKTEDGYRMRGEGDDVYLGQIVEVNPMEGRVVARLNKGGIIDDIELTLDTGERFQQARGPQQLTPLDKENQ